MCVTRTLPTYGRLAKGVGGWVVPQGASRPSRSRTQGRRRMPIRRDTRTQSGAGMDALLRDDPEGAAHERMDPAEVGVCAHRQVGGGLPRLLVVERGERRGAEAELPGVEAAGAVGDRVAHAGREVAGRLAGGDRV